MRLAGFALALSALGFTPHLFAAGNYTQAFGSAPAGWSAINGGWVVNNGEYRNSANLPSPTIAYYGGNTWVTNFTYKLRAYSPWPDTGNKVGAVFGVNSDATHYFLVLVNMSGEVTLDEVSGSMTAPIGTGFVDPTAAGLAADSWFDLEVFVNGDFVTVRVNGKLAIVREEIEPVAGRIGVAARADLGRFDDVNVVDNLATQIFKGTFAKPDGTHVDIGPLHNCSISMAPGSEGERNCWGSIDGEDASGYTWPIELWGGIGELQYNSRNTAADVTLSADAEIEHMVGRTGGNTAALHQMLLRRQTEGHSPQIPYIIRPKGTFTEHPLYFRFWMKSDGNFGLWHMPWQFKADDSYRVSLLIETATPNSTGDPEGGEPCDRSNGNQTPRFVLRGDAADGDPIYWQMCDNSTAVPVNQWFKIEIYFDRGIVSGSGRVWVAINGAEKFDRTIAGGLHAPGNTSPISRIMFPQAYGGNTWPRHQWVDDIDLWNGFPADASAH